MGAGGDEDRIGLGPVGNDRRVLGQAAGAALDLDGADAIAQVAADAALGRRRAEQKLLVGDTASASTAIRTLENWAVPVLPVKGRDVIMHGVSAGPDVARILKSVEKAWVEEDFPDRPRALELVDQMIGRSSD